jgi:hypothetical protein
MTLYVNPVSPVQHQVEIVRGKRRDYRIGRIHKQR